MEIETIETEEGTEITVYTDQKIALSVKTGNEERIYLPNATGNNSTYYVEESSQLENKDQSYKVFHPGEPDEIEVITG